MTSEREKDLGFAAAHDLPIPYLQRTRDYYQALGYGEPYVWAHYSEVPFRPLTKPVRESRVALITTAAPFQPVERQPPAGSGHSSRASTARRPIAATGSPSMSTARKSSRAASKMPSISRSSFPTVPSAIKR
jgi:hypothetical protein